ncbi:MAG TPA: hypothetical protein VKR23_15970 [Gaiellaceae bacterium]|nr:hypothetical protein [Gaiellaceae bacterium]
MNWTLIFEWFSYGAAVGAAIAGFFFALVLFIFLLCKLIDFLEF